MTAVMRLLLMVIALAARLDAAVGGGTASGAEASTVSGYLTQSDIQDAVMEGADTNCLVDTVYYAIADTTCTYNLGVVTFPMICNRTEMNVPMAFIEGSDRQGHMALHTQSLESHMKQLNKKMSPTEKTMFQRVGDFVSASATTQGHAANMFMLIFTIKMKISEAMPADWCMPAFELTHTSSGYAFASEGDHTNGTEFGNWRGIVSNYWLTPWLTPFTALSRALEIPGLCAVDVFKLFCHGGWGTVYPAAGTNPAESQLMNLVDSAWDSLNPTYAPFMTYGPLHLRMGAQIVGQAHSTASNQQGSMAMHALLTRGGYLQPLFPASAGMPGAGSSGGGGGGGMGGGGGGGGMGGGGDDKCIDTSFEGFPSNDIDDEKSEIWMPQLGAKAIAENNTNEVSDQHRNVTAALWPRFTCCNMCAGSQDAAYKHFIVGEGIWPQLVLSTEE